MVVRSNFVQRGQLNSDVVVVIGILVLFSAACVVVVGADVEDSSEAW